LIFDTTNELLNVDKIYFSRIDLSELIAENFVLIYCSWKCYVKHLFEFITAIILCSLLSYVRWNNHQSLIHRRYKKKKLYFQNLKR